MLLSRASSIILRPSGLGKALGAKSLAFQWLDIPRFLLLVPLPPTPHPSPTLRFPLPLPPSLRLSALAPRHHLSCLLEQAPRRTSHRHARPACQDRIDAIGGALSTLHLGVVAVVVATGGRQGPREGSQGGWEQRRRGRRPTRCQHPPPSPLSALPTLSPVPRAWGGRGGGPGGGSERGCRGSGGSGWGG